MKNKIMLLAGILLLSSAAWVWAEVPQKISFAGETFVFAKEKEENGIITYKASSKNGILFMIFAASDPKQATNPVPAANDRLTSCEENPDLYTSCKLDYCANDDIVVSESNTSWSNLIRFTKTQRVWIRIGQKDLRAPISQYRRALCQLEI